MKRIFYAPLCALILLLGGVVAVTTMTTASAADTCPEGDGWAKVDGLSGTTYTYDPPDGYTVTENCYKAADEVHFGAGPTVTSTVTNQNGQIQELSHASFLLVPVEVCPEGQTGTPPNCETPPEECPEGQTGTPPNCETPPEECPEGQTGTPPNCETPPEECPEGQTGTPPNCDERKVVVCKFVGTPPGTLHHIIIVSVSALEGNPDPEELTFPWPFKDAQASFAIRFAEPGEQAKDVDLAECKSPAPPPPPPGPNGEVGGETDEDDDDDDDDDDGVDDEVGGSRDVPSNLPRTGA